MFRIALVALLATPFAIGVAEQPDTRAAEGTEVTRFSDPAITESSGLVVVDGLLVTVNDSGDSGRVFTVDPASGDTVGVTEWAPEPTDVEALAPVYADGVQSSDEVWVGDIGDNTGSRSSITVLRVPVGDGETDLGEDVESYEFVYPDGARDAESMFTDPATGRLYLVSKSVVGGAFYAAPAELDPDGLNTLERLTDGPFVATDAAFLPGSDRVVVRSYVSATVYEFPRLVEVEEFELPDQRQGEGVAADPADPATVLLTSEGVNQPVLRVDLPGTASTASASPSAAASDNAENPETTAGTSVGRPTLIAVTAAGILAAVVALGLLLRRRPR